MINCNFDLTLTLYDESLREYLKTIEDVKSISISDLREMVEWEACKDFNKGDLHVGNIVVSNAKGETVDFNLWFDFYIKRDDKNEI